MNLIEQFQHLMSQVPELVQPLIVALAAAVPFVEGEGGVVIGLLGGINPVVAVIAAVLGNFICVAILVVIGARARRAIVTRHRARRAALVGGPDAVELGDEELEAPEQDAIGSTPKRRAKFRRALERYGVPGVSLLGPLLLPTQFTATMLTAIGVRPAWVLLWQGIAIVLWTIAVALLATGVLHVVG